MKTKKLALSFMLIASAAITSNAQQLPNNSFEEAWVDCVPWNSVGNTIVKGKTPTSWTISHVIGMRGTGATEVGNQEKGSGKNNSNGESKDFFFLPKKERTNNNSAVASIV